MVIIWFPISDKLIESVTSFCRFRCDGVNYKPSPYPTLSKTVLLSR